MDFYCGVADYVGALKTILLVDKYKDINSYYRCYYRCGVIKAFAEDHNFKLDNKNLWKINISY